MNYDLVDFDCVDFKKLLLFKGKSIHLSDQESHLLMLMMGLDELGVRPITPEVLQRYSSLTDSEIDHIMLKLIDAHYVDRINGVLDFDPVKKMLLNIKPKEKKKKVNLISLFEDAFGRSLSSTEIELINDFKRSGYDDEMIADALKEAVKSNVHNFRYVERILENWARYGKKTRPDHEEEADDVSDEVKNYNWW